MENFLVQYISWWSESPTSIFHCCETLSGKAVSIWSIKEDVLHVTLVGDFISCSKPYKEQNWKKFLTSGDIDWVFIWRNIYFCFENKLILKPPKIYISVSLVLIFEKCSVIVSVKLPWIGGR